MTVNNMDNIYNNMENIYVQLNYISSSAGLSGLGTLKYCLPTMVCCLKFEIHLTMGKPSKVKPTL